MELIAIQAYIEHILRYFGKGVMIALAVENTLRSLNSDDECQIVVTGSNAKILSSELSTYLSGRYADIHIQSLSYKEFLRFHNLDDTAGSLDSYLSYGGRANGD